MFGLIRSPTYSDAVLGKFDRRRGRWRGTIDLAGVQIPLAISGGRKEPDARALDLAKQLTTVYARERERVGLALFEHFAPYAEAVADGEVTPDAPLPAIRAPSDTWHYVIVESASVSPLGRDLCAEVAMRCAWDEEHTLGARFIGGVFAELNGSILQM